MGHEKDHHPGPRSPMNESDPTGYRESPATTDGPAAADQADDAAEGSATLTTDEDAQGDDGVVRPGNAPD
jgi:hypothetical protein